MNTAVTTLFAGKHLSLLRRGHWEFATRNGDRSAVGIVAITHDSHVVLVEQFRPPVGETVIELPAGLVGDVAGHETESYVDAAKRELLEETGYTAEHWSELGHGYSSPGLTDEATILFLAEGLMKQGLGGGDESEQITVHEVAVEGLFDWLQKHQKSVDVKLLAGLFAAQQYRQRRDSS